MRVGKEDLDHGDEYTWLLTAGKPDAFTPGHSEFKTPGHTTTNTTLPLGDLVSTWATASAACSRGNVLSTWTLTAPRSISSANFVRRSVLTFVNWETAVTPYSFINASFGCSSIDTRRPPLLSTLKERA